MKKKEVGESFLIRSILRSLYKSIGFWFGERKARLIGVRNESWSVVVFEKGITREVTA